LLALSAVLVGGNWLLFIWAVNNHHMLEASLGYFMRPLTANADERHHEEERPDHAMGQNFIGGNIVDKCGAGRWQLAAVHLGGE
jgi:hypothetical protein